jgi:hypothetical protein
MILPERAEYSLTESALSPFQADPNNLSAFKEELQKRIDRRLVIVGPPAGKPRPVWDELWIEKNRLRARKEFREIGLAAFTETRRCPGNGEWGKGGGPFFACVYAIPSFI